MSTTRDGPPDSITERITDPARMLNVLERIQTARTLLTVHIPNHKTHYTSALLEIIPDQGLIVLDELNPAANGSIQPGIELHVRAVLKGVEISFKSTVVNIDHKENLAIYRLKIPTLILYQQRRNAFRLSMSGAQNNAVIIHPPGQDKAEGRLIDISLGGVGAHLTNTISLTKGDMVPKCEILLPKLNYDIISDLEVCFIKIDEKNNSLRLGGRFHNMEKQQDKTLSRLLLQLQREQLRKTF